jgi:plasmid maintenance system antidote protein VapI
MNQRLRKIIDELKNARSVYTDADFARIVDVSRSELSQMLSGKRPVSKRLVSNLLTEFPTINEDWLMTGAGEMLDLSTPQTVTATLSAEEGSTAFIGDNNKVNADQTIAMLVAEVAAQRRVTEKVLEQNSELLAMIAANNKR